MKKVIVSTSMFCILMLASCTKQLAPLSPEQKSQNAISEIRKIIGNDETIKMVDNPNSSPGNNQSESIDLNESGIRKLSIDEFRKVYNDFKYKKAIFSSIKEVKVDSIYPQNVFKTNAIINWGDDTYDDFGEIGSGGGGVDKPRPAGLYRSIFRSEILQYAFMGYIDGNNPTLFSNLNVEFKSDSKGMVVGTPVLSFSGVRFFGWNQISSYLVSSNPSSFTSVFYVTGRAEFLLGLGETVFGMGGNTTFKITINMDENVLQITKIEIAEFANVSN
ncbi:MAG: hypothetical protein RLZ56_1356 [Bacteroidota bacterium]|jgi:hypothetical protein